ncbi:hypothetical protein E2C01_025256 [Portunus trituberculatus]|uniref:Uncharacterized protein n=1 Tax=Portunus trituberculatus TaxID=210409 RepID=A0A5B7EEZ3_PORTR|nr:hypothetical protein [Portunus trituberculatus]
MPLFCFILGGARQTLSSERVMVTLGSLEFWCRLEMLHLGHMGSQLPVPGGAGGADEHAKVHYLRTVPFVTCLRNNGYSQSRVDIHRNSSYAHGKVVLVLVSHIPSNSATLHTFQCKARTSATP